eukprot:1434032-Prymnesium_polylepis.2
MVGRCRAMDRRCGEACPLCAVGMPRAKATRAMRIQDATRRHGTTSHACSPSRILPRCAAL